MPDAENSPGFPVLRVLASDDVVALQRVAEATFRETFAEENTTEDLEAYAAQRLSAKQLTDELANPNSVFVFAERHGVPLGYLKLNKGTAQTEDRGPSAVELERIYVLRKAQGGGIGAQLLTWALAWAEAQGASELWLGVWEHNHLALKFYAQHGFEPVGSHVFMLGDDAQTDLILRRRIGTASQAERA